MQHFIIGCTETPEEAKRLFRKKDELQILLLLNGGPFALLDPSQTTTLDWFVNGLKLMVGADETFKVSALAHTACRYSPAWESRPRNMSPDDWTHLEFTLLVGYLFDLFHVVKKSAGLTHWSTIGTGSPVPSRAELPFLFHYATWHFSLLSPGKVKEQARESKRMARRRARRPQERMKYVRN